MTPVVGVAVGLGVGVGVRVGVAVGPAVRILNDDITSLQADPTHDVLAVKVHTVPPKLLLGYESTIQPVGMRSDDIQLSGTSAGSEA